MRAYAGRQFVPFLWWSLVWSGELTTYRARGGHATDWANPTRSNFFFFFLCKRVKRRKGYEIWTRSIKVCTEVYTEQTAAANYTNKSSTRGRKHNHTPFCWLFYQFPKVLWNAMIVNHVVLTHGLNTWPQTYDGYSALHTQDSMYLNGGILSVECESWV